MIQINFEKQDVDKFYDNFLRAEHHKTRLKNFALYLKCTGLPHKEICGLCRISKPTLASYLKDFQSGGFESFHKLKWKGQKSKLNDHVELISSDFEANPPKSIHQAQERIGELTKIRRCPTQIREFLRSKLNYRYLKAGSLPGNGKDDDDKKELEREGFKKNDSNHYWAKPETERK